MSRSGGALLLHGEANPPTQWEARVALRAEVVEGLASTPPRLPPKLFYDEVGAHLFEEITRLPEYYPTRTELGILRRHLPEMACWLGSSTRVVELGSGSGKKTQWLLESLDQPSSYTPVDIAAAQLEGTARRLRQRFPGLAVNPVVTDYIQPFSLPESGGAGSSVLFFPGSTIGNFEPDEAKRFLQRFGSLLGSGARLVIGVDLEKPRETLEAAYNDAQGVTARFNLNALTHLNRVLGTELHAESFRHRAIWSPEASRIEMHLVATTTEHVTVPPPLYPEGSQAARSAPFSRTFQSGDFVVTEHSYKYTRKRFEKLLAASGWTPENHWTDRKGWFAVYAATWRSDPDE